MRQGSHLKRSRGRPHSQGNGVSSSPSLVDGRSLASTHSSGHNGSQSRKHVSMRHQTFVSNGPDGVRVSGNGFTILEKYLNLARDASTGGDRIAAENFYQHAEHYFRIINANNEGQFTPQTPREHFEADIPDAAAAGEAASPGEHVVDETMIGRDAIGHDETNYGENIGDHDAMPQPSRQFDPRYAERNMDEGRSSHRRSRHYEEEGGNSGPHLNHPNQTRGRGRFRERRPNQLYQTGRGGGSGSSSHNGGDGHHNYTSHDPIESGEHSQNYRQNNASQPMGGDSYGYQNPRYRNQPRYDLGGAEQPDIGHHYGDAHRASQHASPQPSFELSPPQPQPPPRSPSASPSALPEASIDSRAIMEGMRPRRMSLTPNTGRGPEGVLNRPNDGNLPHHAASQNQNSDETE